MVYLVDDDSEDIEIIQQALLDNSYKGPVDIAANGRLLLDKLEGGEQHKPDVIVMDLNMPLMNGFEALKEIKRNPVLKQIPVIVLTASSRKEDEIRCFELGCHYFFTKPNNMDDYRPLVILVKKFAGNKAA